MIQDKLLDVAPDFRFKGAGHRRTHMGSVMEEVVCGVLGFTRATTGGKSVYRPDAHDSLDRPVEIKSVCINSNLKGKSVLYDFRLEKDRVHAPQLAYVFACHMSVGKGKAKTMAEFLGRLQYSLSLAIVPAWVVRNDASECDLRTIKSKRKSNKRIGYERKGYAEGYRNLQVTRYLTEAPCLEVKTYERWGRKFVVNVATFEEDPWSQEPPAIQANPDNYEQENFLME